MHQVVVAVRCDATAFSDEESDFRGVGFGVSVAEDGIGNVFSIEFGLRARCHHRMSGQISCRNMKELSGYAQFLHIVPMRALRLQK